MATAVLDIGKTNLKLLAIEDGRVVDRRSLPNRSLPGPPYPHHDLAAIGRMLLRNDGSFLKPESIAELERVAWRFDGANGETSKGFYCQYGLAVTTLPTGREGCADDLFGDGRAHVGHAVPHVLPGLASVNRLQRVPMIRRGDDRRIYI